MMSPRPKALFTLHRSGRIAPEVCLTCGNFAHYWVTIFPETHNAVQRRICGECAVRLVNDAAKALELL